jgi:hypothetical protein
MSTIQISDLNSIGLNLLSDYESFMNDLDEDESEIPNIHGGCTPFALGLYAGLIITTHFKNA